jgi:hypothetical protein
MADALEVRPQALLAHAVHVESTGDRVAAAADAGATVVAGSDAYGKLCAMVPVLLGALQNVLVDGVAAAAESLGDTGSRLRETARSYEETDDRQAAALRTIRDGG